MKRALLSVAAAIAPVVGFADITWGTNGATTAFNSDGTTALVASRDDQIGYFVQLIDAGPDLTANLTIDYSDPTGTAGDDFVVDVAWFGASTASAVAGRLTSQGESHIPGHVYYVRAWNAPHPDAVTGTTSVLNVSLADGNESTRAPLNSATFYGNAAPITTPSTGSSSDPIAYNFAVVTNLPVVAVPEPTTAALLGVGMGGVLMALKRRRQNA